VKRRNVLALVLTGVCVVGAVVGVPRVAQAQAPTASAADTKKQAQALFDEGKRRYDARDYTGALETFRQGAALEPTKGRWPYNQALALRKLKRKQEARDAFLRSLQVEPTYRRADVLEKLQDMGFSPPSETPAPGTGSSPGGTETPHPPADTGSPGTPGTTGDTGPSVDTGPSPGGASADSRPGGSETRTDSPAAPSAPETQAADPVSDAIASIICCMCPVVGLGGLGFLVYWLVRRSKAKSGGGDGGGGSGWPQPTARTSTSAADLESRNTRLVHLSDTLIRVEHALRLGEDDDTRALLNRATLAEQRAFEALARAREGKGQLAAVDAALQEAEALARQAEARAQANFGPLAFSGDGERVGCYFCARPLANSDFRVQVPLKRGSSVDTVLACRPCANLVAAGQSPEVKVVQDGGRTLHWSEVPDYDPYIHQHRRYFGSRAVPAYDFTPGRSVAELAAMAAGGAVVGGLAVYGISKLLDLDSAREADAARAAAEAAAMRASQERDSFSSTSSTSSSSSDTWQDRS
jgi:tetratricopeptide (TPR) repeat protein